MNTWVPDAAEVEHDNTYGDYVPWFDLKPLYKIDKMQCLSANSGYLVLAGVKYPVRMFIGPCMQPHFKTDDIPAEAWWAVLK